MKKTLVLAVAVLVSSIVTLGEEVRKGMTLTAITEIEGKYFADGPVYLDLVLSNDTTNDIRLGPYPSTAAQGTFSFLGRGIIITLKDIAGTTISYGEEIKPVEGAGHLYPPDWTLGSRDSWRWSVDIRMMLQWFPWTKEKALPSGEVEVTVCLVKEGITSSPVKIRMVRGDEGAATAQAAETLRKKVGGQNPILRPEVLEGTELNEQVLPTFKRMVRALATIGKARRGEADSTILSILPSETDWGIWEDDIAVARYVHTLKTDKGKAKQIREETETKFPGIRWLLDKIDNNPDYCWLHPVF